jgi:radical SAM protein with 4Fe4S-binding SPASM domain
MDKKSVCESLVDVGLELTTGCNLRCVHCWQGEKAHLKILKLDEIKLIIKRLAELGVTSVRITGGEPMIHPNFWEIMDEATHQSLSMVLRTNGTLIDEVVAQRLRDYPIISTELSIDGFTSQDHDRFRRKKGSLQKTFSALDLLIKNGVKTRVKTVMNRKNIGSLLDLGKLLARDHTGIEIWSLVDLVPLGNTISYFQELMPEPSNVIRVMKSIGEWRKQQHIPFKILGSALQLVTNPIEAIRSNRSLMYPCDYRKGYLYICADGSVKKCAWLSDSLGTITEDISQMWQSGCRKYKASTPAECKQCEFFKQGLCGYMYYVCPEIPCFTERKEFFRLLRESFKNGSP